VGFEIREAEEARTEEIALHFTSQGGKAGVDIREREKGEGTETRSTNDAIQTVSG